ncbi:lytic transglycosylase catalytic [Caballeronia temeraria]|uniref:Lytic transglycosylase catalytic n=1 Tax=Caballeronia temeraria TaxID=1777137 RepID=A0A158DA40_9BURK|nr:transglycosylase SLT domain-containing protein [Caballeronia temeraria]SAK91230.1 lytic transglycosylase catalytic [Caballeronia temeraria]
MRRVLATLAAFAVSLSAAHTALAQEHPLAASDTFAFSPAADDPKVEQASHKISDMLMRKFGVAREKAQTIATAVMSSSSKYSLPPALLLAIISIESRFRETARGPNNATGLMQVVPSAHKKLVRNVDLTDPEDNIETGSAILHGYVKSAQGDFDAALKSYGGSRAYAEKVSLRAKSFEPAASVDAASAGGQ